MLIGNARNLTLGRGKTHLLGSRKHLGALDGPGGQSDRKSVV